MKKLTLFILTIFTVATLYAAARPSLDGRAVVAESGTMPRGLFARTVGYLPGDSVTVTNPATGSTIDVLILGAIDPSEGVAILLSPESAEALRIKPDSNVQVKLTKRAGSLDENANGSAVLSDGEDEREDETTSIAALPSSDEEDYAEETAVPEQPVYTPPVTTKKEVHKAVIIPEGPEETEPYEEIAAVPETTEPVEEIPAVPEPKPVKKYEPVVEEKVKPEPVVAEKSDAKNFDLDSVDTVYEELPPLNKDELTYDGSVQRVVVLEGESPVTEERVSEELVKAEPIPQKHESEELPVDEETLPALEEERLQPVVVVEEEAVRPENEFVSEADSLSPVEEELPAGIESEPVVVMNEEPAAEEYTDEYQPIVLVPADANPPVAEQEENGEPIAQEIASSEDFAPVESEDSEPVKTIVSNDWSNYVVPSLKNLRSGCYYVQVASLGNTDNIKAFVDKYSSKYPVVIAQNASKTAYQVLVGPLNIDEYGSVDEKFKAYGFKDSFVRKIK